MLEFRGREEVAILDMLDLISLDRFTSGERDSMAGLPRDKWAPSHVFLQSLRRTDEVGHALLAGAMSTSRRSMDRRGLAYATGPKAITEYKYQLTEAKRIRAAYLEYKAQQDSAKVKKPRSRRPRGNHGQR